MYKPEKWDEGIPEELVKTWEKTKKSNDNDNFFNKYKELNSRRHSFRRVVPVRNALDHLNVFIMHYF